LWYNTVLATSLEKPLKGGILARKLRLLTDSTIKHDKAVEILTTKVELMEARKKHKKNYHMRSDATKVEVVKTYLALGGNLKLTAEAVQIPYRTLYVWKCSDWWKNLIAECKKVEKLEMSHRTKMIVEKSMTLLEDRLLNGDIIYNQKTGELIRKPVMAKDLHTIAKDMLDRKLLLDKSFEEKVIEVSKDDRLADLAARFASLAEKALEKPKPHVEVTDVIFAEEIKHA
jgi:hypothetical protein